MQEGKKIFQTVSTGEQIFRNWGENETQRHEKEKHPSERQ